MISKRVLKIIACGNSELEQALAKVVEAAEKMSKCGGGCEGPLGCMCGGQVGREALAALDSTLKAIGF